jgi:hypothetical protein
MNRLSNARRLAAVKVDQHQATLLESRYKARVPQQHGRVTSAVHGASPWLRAFTGLSLKLTTSVQDCRAWPQRLA